MRFLTEAGPRPRSPTPQEDSVLWDELIQRLLRAFLAYRSSVVLSFLTTAVGGYGLLVSSVQVNPIDGLPYSTGCAVQLWRNTREMELLSSPAPRNSTDSNFFEADC